MRFPKSLLMLTYLASSMASAAISNPLAEVAFSGHLAGFLIFMAIVSVLFFAVVFVFVRLHRWIQTQEADAAVAFQMDRTVRESCKFMLEGSPYRVMVEQLLQAFKDHNSVASQIDLNDWIANNIDTSLTANRGQIVVSTRIFKVFAILFMGAAVLFALYDVSQVIALQDAAKSLPVKAYLGALYGLMLGFSLLCVSFLVILYLESRNQHNVHRFTLFGQKMHALFMATADQMEYSSPKYALRLALQSDVRRLES